ncbi:hypothetical protein MNBD_GAMMA12-2047 [hydrothermal vent metagenome]|uniref:Uncharacterized protein n=1 Tax=hydrothermal vent metagenome TaxID=652676 RepID=A0A3B0YA29_9ZZZZ
MKSKKPLPGVSRDKRIDAEGLKRLEQQLVAGRRISQAVLDQWVKRYGDSAKTIIEKYAQ